MGVPERRARHIIRQSSKLNTFPRTFNFAIKSLATTFFVYLPSTLKMERVLFSWKKLLQKETSVVLKIAF